MKGFFKNVSTILLFTISIYLLVSCSKNVTKKTRYKNLSYLYKERLSSFHPKYQIYNFSPQTSRLSIRLPLKDFYFSSDKQERYSRISISYQIFEQLNEIPVDSGQVLEKAIDDSSKIYANFLINIKRRSSKAAFIKLKILELISRRERIDYLKIKDFKTFNRQNISIKPLNTNYAPAVIGSQILLNKTYKIASPYSAIWVKQNKLSYQAASPPYKTSNSQAKTEQSALRDSVFLLKNKMINLKEAQRLTFSNDSSFQHSFSIFAYDSLDKVHTPFQFVQALQYLIKPKDYNKLLQSPNLKYALDQFWLSRSENEIQAQMLLQFFYQRVEEANKYFTQNRAGWMSDRGMIFIVFGAPDLVYKSANLERWIYSSEEKNEDTEDLSFDFELKKKINQSPFKDMYLKRLPYYKRIWETAQKTWSEGRPFFFDGMPKNKTESTR